MRLSASPVAEGAILLGDIIARDIRSDIPTHKSNVASKDSFEARHAVDVDEFVQFSRILAVCTPSK